jgi:hypothetical protein
MTMFTILNRSTRVSDDQVKTMVGAIAHQVRYHLGPAWGRTLAPVVFSVDPSTAPPGSYAITVLDDADQAEDLGWHTEETGSVVYGVVYAAPVLDGGGNALTDPFSVASVLSHEVLETMVDPSCNLWADNGRGTAYALEVCDPVEADAYPVTYGTTRVMVSNFVTPAWFDPQAKATSRFDQMRRTSRPFTMTKGGYVVLLREGATSAQYGEQWSPHRHEAKGRPNHHARGKGHPQQDPKDEKGHRS